MSGSVRSRTLVVVNPASAGGRTRQRWQRHEHHLRALGIDFDVHLTTSPGSATRSVREALGDGVARIVSVGGDGTLNEVVNGFFDEAGAPLGTAASLCVVPSGSGGDFGRTAGIAPAPGEALRVLSEGHIKAIDVGRIDFDDGTRRYFLNVADCGIGGEVVARVNGSRFKGGGVRGSAVFLWESLATLLQYRGGAVRVTVDGEVVERTVQSVVVANGRYFGGGMCVAPDAELDDGVFDIVIIAAAGRARSMMAMPSLYRGTHVRRPEVETRRGSVIRVQHVADPLLFDVEGEQVGSTGATITCLPGAIRLYVLEQTGPRAQRA